MSKKLSSDWMTTAAAAAALGVTSKHLRESLRKELKEGQHYRNVSPGAARPSYRWHLKRIENLLSKS